MADRKKMEKKTDRNTKPLSENLWIKYQKKRIKAWFGSLKNGKWDRRKIFTVAG